MTKSMVNKLPAAGAHLQPDLYKLFRETVATIDVADAAGSEIERDIGYTTADAILQVAADVVPADVKNVLHRLGCVHYLLDIVYDRSFRGLQIDDVIEQMTKLLASAAEGLAASHQVDMRATRLDFYFPRQPDRAN